MEHRVSRWSADTCALVDFYTADPALSGSIRNLFEDEDADVAVAATTIWEIGIKTERRRLMDIRGIGHATLNGYPV